MAGLSVAVDKEARDHCVAVVKGTYEIRRDGGAVLAEQQRPLLMVDEHHGDPGSTCVRHESDFAPFKPFTDVLVHGAAVSSRPATQVLVRLDLLGRHKEMMVTGDRRWEAALGGLRASEPRPFTRMPISFDHAFGGTDLAHPDPRHHGCETRNPTGRGFHASPRDSDAAGTLLPNVEDPRALVRRWTDRPAPIGCGVVGRHWQPRAALAGTYDAQWLAKVAPFLPADFDSMYHQAAPGDQQFPTPGGGERLHVQGMTEQGSWGVVVPRERLSIYFCFREREVVRVPVIDTIVLDCEEQRLVVTWRTSIPLGKKLTALREVEVHGAGGRPTSSRPPRYTRGKPHFAGLAAYIAWLRGQGARR